MKLTFQQSPALITSTSIDSCLLCFFFSTEPRRNPDVSKHPAPDQPDYSLHDEHVRLRGRVTLWLTVPWALADSPGVTCNKNCVAAVPVKLARRSECALSDQSPWVMTPFIFLLLTRFLTDTPYECMSHVCTAGTWRKDHCVHVCFAFWDVFLCNLVCLFIF